MSHLTLSSQLNLALKLDGAAEGAGGPVPRWQRKARDKGLTIKSSSGDNSKLRSLNLMESGIFVIALLLLPVSWLILHQTLGCSFDNLYFKG